MNPWNRVAALTRFKAFEARDGVTYCNEFIQAAAFLWGCEDVAGRLIRDLHLHVQAHPGTWRPVGLGEGQLCANQGRLVLALYSTPEPKGDHGCIIVPGRLEASGTWGEHVPQCANVGTANFYGKKLSFAFNAKEKPILYLLEGS